VLVLVSFVLVLAAAVTLVVGLLQSGLTLIYLSIGCSVLAGVVLAIAVLRGRPEPRPAAVGRAFTPPAPAAQVPASVGATTSGAEAATTWSEPYPSASPAPTPPPPPPPPPPPTRSPAAPSDEAATKAAGTALLGRLRGRKVGDATPQPEAPPFTAADVAAPSETAEMPLVSVPEEDEDEFPIAGYEQMRATDLLRQLGALDRNQLEAVRDREASGRNRFTVMNRIDTLLAAKAEPAWEVADDEWEAEVVETSVIEVGPADVELDEDEEEAFAVIAVGEVEDDEVDELVAPVDDFPIAGYEALTVGQILPRLSELDADQLAQVRAREQQGRGRGTILDRVDRLAAKTASGALAMPPAAPARRPPARKAPAAKAPAPRKARAPRAPAPPAPPAAPMKEAVKRARAAKAAPPPPPPAAPAKRAAKAVPPAKKAPAARRAPARKATAAPTASPMKEAVKKARARKTT
jgi:hypothetical protein